MAVFVVSKSKIDEILADPENLFEFRLKRGGPKYTIPKLGYLRRESSRILQNPAGVNGIELFRRVLAVECPDAAEIVDGFEDDQVGELSDAWVVASGAQVSEPEGS